MLKNMAFTDSCVNDSMPYIFGGPLGESVFLTVDLADSDLLLLGGYTNDPEATNIVSTYGTVPMIVLQQIGNYFSIWMNTLSGYADSKVT